LFGWILAALWDGSRKVELRCAQCNAVFRHRSEGSTVALVVLIIIVVLVALGILGSIFIPEE
jgi:uncharacterized protein (DUF983 family)